jgi:phosphomevalonate kinase
MSSSAVAVSAPGKVLFAGGFLVLDRKHTGLVFGLNARIHVHVEAWSEDDQTQLFREEGKGVLAFVQSPQFKDARWLYKTSPHEVDDDQAIQIEQITV